MAPFVHARRIGEHGQMELIIAEWCQTFFPYYPNNKKVSKFSDGNRILSVIICAVIPKDDFFDQNNLML